MPRLNSLGEALMGVGGGGVTSIDGAEPTNLVGVTSGDFAWLNSTTIVGKAEVGTYDIYTLVPPGGALVQVGDDESTYLWAGGNVWTAYAAAFPGIQSNVAALEFPLAGVGDVAADGWSALIVNFAADSGINVYNATGVLQNSVSVTVFPENGTIRLRGSVLSYPDAERNWTLRNRSTNALIPFAPRTTVQTVLVPVTVGSTVYVLERDVTTPGERLTIRAATGSMGYVITDAGIVYNPDVISLSGNVVRVAYSTGQAELPDELVMWDINLTSGAASKATIVGGVPVWVAQTPLTVTLLPASAVSGSGDPAINDSVYKNRLADTNGLATRPWLRFWQALATKAIAPLNLSNVTGILDQDNGGTGTTTGLTEINVSAIDFSDESLLLGRGEGSGAGPGQEITLGAGLAMTGTELDITGVGAGINQLTGDVTAGPGTGSQAATIANDAVTYAKMQNVSAASRLLGRGSAAGAGNVEEITLGTGLSMSGTTLNGTAAPTTYMSPLTTGGDPTTAELIFAPDGDVVMVPVSF